MGQKQSKTMDHEFDRMNSYRRTRTERGIRSAGTDFRNVSEYDGTVKIMDILRNPSGQSRKPEKSDLRKIETTGYEDNYNTSPFKPHHTDMMRLERTASQDYQFKQRLTYFPGSGAQPIPTETNDVKNRFNTENKGKTESEVHQFQKDMTLLPSLGVQPLQTNTYANKERLNSENKEGTSSQVQQFQKDIPSLPGSGAQPIPTDITQIKERFNRENKGITESQVHQPIKDITLLPGFGVQPMQTDTCENKEWFNSENKEETSSHVQQFQKDMPYLPGSGAQPIPTETNEIKERFNNENKGSLELIEWPEQRMAKNDSSLILAWAHRTVQTFNILITTSTWVRQQQDEAFFESSRADREKEKRRQEEIERQEKEQLRLRQERETKEKQFLERELRKVKLEKMLPSEPEQDHPDSIRILLLTPSGQRIERRFLRNQSLKLLYYYVFCHKECTEDFQIETNFPRKTLVCEPIDGQTDPPSFAEAGLGRSEMLFVHT